MGVVARYSLKETLRKRLLVAAGGLTGLFLLLFFLFLKWVGLPPDVPGARSIAALTYLFLGLFASYVMIALFAVLIFVASISAEIDDGTILAVVPRPIHRSAIVLGKWMGLSLVTLVYASLLFWGVVLIDQAQFGGVAGAFGSLLAAYGDFLLEGLLVGTVTILGSILAATMTNGIVVSSAVLIAFLGGSLQQLGALTNPAPAFSVIGWITSLLMPTDALYRRALFQIMGNHVFPGADTLLGPFGAVHPPGEGMVLYALVYTAGMLMLAVWRFGVKDL
ncbi:ABC transporter permease [Sulfobacillus harzensis]|uniref:ABC transporter permease n=1 Tax=Sulfobacillus harzensis TaxID=2729629 RepID=A0A7Y0L420_9FIRM|nr:ABC transporter permease [Sulfobacillus harzensis]NMP22917.1 ABC transporter permease [Sulfobacillus harzensis]